MIGPGGAARVYVYRSAVDMRKSIDGLACLVQEAGLGGPRSGTVFVFFNRVRDKVKLLWWDRTGFWLGYKRLERGSFRMLSVSELSWTDLQLVLEGIDLSVRRLPTVEWQRAA